VVHSEGLDLFRGLALRIKEAHAWGGGLKVVRYLGFWRLQAIDRHNTEVHLPNTGRYLTINVLIGTVN
jgi:hypothetical protein